MIAISLLLAAQTAGGSGMAYSGEPELNSFAPYRIVTHGVTIDLDAASGGGPAGTATVNSLTTYRNQGGAGKATLILPRSQFGPDIPTFDITATWDGQPIVLHNGQASRSDSPQITKEDLVASVPLKAQGTHALRVHLVVPVRKAGYGSVEYETGYGLNSDRPIELFSIAYRYPGHVVFGLPQVRPAMGWEVGNAGAATRKTGFTPAQPLTVIKFYPDSFGTIGG